MLKPIRITKQRLHELKQETTAQDRAILKSLLSCRYLTGQQLVRLHFSRNAETPTAAAYAAYRCLNRLRDYGLIQSLQRRIGGVRAGSGSFVWTLTSGGFRLIHMDSTGVLPRRQFREPSPHFLAHTLLISEAYLQFTEICAQNNMTLSKVQFEPGCWRQYRNNAGKQLVLKPDLYAVTQGSGYEDCWFIEIDCDTETVARILDKCDRYIHYLRSGTEQKQPDVFPYVIWIVPNEKRKRSLQKHICTQYPRGGQLFLVILPDELKDLLAGGAEKYIQNLDAKGGTS